EVVFFTIAGMITLIALARGYKQELGATVVILIAILLLSFFEDEILGVFANVGEALFGPQYTTSTTRDLFLMFTFQIIFVIIVFMGYAGVTLAFPGTEALPPLGTFITLLVGLLNGYLIAGTLWYYLDKFGYPVQQIGLVCLPLTPLAQQLVTILPQVIFASPTYWIVPLATLLILRVRG
ncbi:MAG TPA: hypothetical protein PKE45_18860, partial [Caldilineaceae bacterium]|nr:hypothetical protein [Caldilineaceae bacterium]